MDIMVEDYSKTINTYVSCLETIKTKYFNLFSSETHAFIIKHIALIEINCKVFSLPKFFYE